MTIKVSHTERKELTLESALEIKPGDKVHVRDMDGERLNAVKEGESYEVFAVYNRGKDIFYAVSVPTSIGESVTRYLPHTWCSSEKYIRGSDPRNLKGDKK